jgi:molecular chaperone HscA
VHVLQGERDLVSDCRSLARFELRGFPPMVAGAARIRVTYSVDADGLLNVEAEELTSSVKANIEVKPSYGLTDSEIESMLRDSIDHAQDDMEARRLREQQVEADRVIEALVAALETDGEALLNEEERAGIIGELEKLIEISRGDDHVAIEEAIKALEQHCEFYVERRMNSTISQAMSGHKVDEFE